MMTQEVIDAVAEMEDALAFFVSEYETWGEGCDVPTSWPTAKGRSTRWHAANASRAELVAKLDAADGAFFQKMRDSLAEWGSLTAGQEAAVRRILLANETQKAERKAERLARDAGSEHVGTVGKRQTFAVTLANVLSFDTQFGELHVHIMHDAAGNVIVYKGSKTLGVKGETLTIKATVKDHGEREGVKQTVVSRPAREG